jgi:hypothetical protein
MVARRDRLPWLTAIALSPGVFTSFAHGQTAFLTSAALITGFRESQRRPVVAGACFALLAAKPQIALVVPVALAALRAWRTLAATVLFVGIYIGATVAAFGVEPWQRFIDSTLPQQFAVLNSAHTKAVMMISPYFLFRGLGLPLSATYGLQLCFSLVALGWLFVIIRHERDENVRILMMACAVLVASAYLQTYELPLLVAAVARICASEESSSRIGTTRLNLICASVKVALLAFLVLAATVGINFIPLIPLALLAGLGWNSLSRTNLLKFPGIPFFRERRVELGQDVNCLAAGTLRIDKFYLSAGCAKAPALICYIPRFPCANGLCLTSLSLRNPQPSRPRRRRPRRRLWVRCPNGI